MFLSVLNFAYLPITLNDTTYGKSILITTNATSPDIGSVSAFNHTIIYPDEQSFIVTSYNNSNIWNSTLTLNESGTWIIYATVFNDTSSETNSTTITVTCPTWKTIDTNHVCYEALAPYVDTNLSYYDVGDNITLRVNLNSNSVADDVWLYSSDNSTYQFTYSISKGNWYVYYKVRQKQEVLSVQSFVGGIADGIGDIALTINPNPPTPSMFESMFRDLFYYGIIILFGLAAIITLIFTIKYSFSRRQS
jgi:hypothetical protein